MEPASIWNTQPYTLWWWHSPLTTTKWKSTPKEDLPPGQEWMDMIIFTYGYMTENNLEAMQSGDKAKFIQMLGKEKRKPVYLLWPQDRSSVWFLPCVFSDQHRLRTQLNQGPVLPGSVQDGEGVHTGQLCGCRRCHSGTCAHIPIKRHLATGRLHLVLTLMSWMSAFSCSPFFTRNEKKPEPNNKTWKKIALSFLGIA